MSSEVTITITIGGTGQTAATHLASVDVGAPPAPAALEELQTAGTGESPVPLEVAQLSRLRGEVSPSSAGLPEPMPVDQLSAGSFTMAPPPADVSSLASQVGGGSPPAPLSVEELAAAADAGGNSEPAVSQRSKPKPPRG
ncbi:hypothetical protein ACPW96_04150 [Micromonospora sp. DT81.3]|uniref:hypothetical protein n=1 Tax=Micromonospora sp. DT81.3 TaxID=3416523 RepID=UPI003CF56F15